MKAPLLYRIASVLLLLMALGHTLGFRRVDPRWRVDPIIAALRSTHFEVQGLNRTYWDFYIGFGLFVTVLLIFIALLSWQLGGLPKQSLLAMPVVRWGLAVCLLVVTFLSWKYFFIAPLVFSGVITITICLIFAAWTAGNPMSLRRRRLQSIQIRFAKKREFSTEFCPPYENQRIAALAIASP
jgi:hypothetical protein